MKRCVLVLVILSLFSACVTASKSSSKSDKVTCLDTYDGLLKKRNLFVGFGSAYTMTSAVEAARADMTMQIRTKVEGKFSSYKSNTSESFSILTSSAFSEILVGIKVERRCPAASGGYEAIVSLKKPLFIENISNALTMDLDKAKDFLTQIKTAKNEASRLRLLLGSKRYLEAKVEFVTANFHLCKTFSGCSGLSLGSMNALHTQVAKSFKSNQFRWRNLDKLSKKLKSDLSSLLAKESIIVTEGDSKRLLDSTCWRRVYQKTKSHEYMFVDVTCRVVGFVDNVQVFTYSFGARGHGVSEAEASHSASMQLELEK